MLNVQNWEFYEIPLGLQMMYKKR